MSAQDEYREELEAQNRAAAALKQNINWSPHLKVPNGVEFLKIPTKGIRRLNFFRYPKTIDGGVFTGMKFAAYREYSTHEVGPMKTKVLCPFETYGKPCTLCQRKAAAFRDSSLSKEEKKAKAKPYFTSSRRLYLVADAETNPGKIMIWDVASNCFPGVLDAKIAMAGEAMLGWNSAKDGKTLVVMFEDKPMGNDGKTFRNATNIEVEARKFVYKTEHGKQIIDLDSILVQLSDDEIMKMFNGGDDPDEVDTKDTYVSGGNAGDEEGDEWIEEAASGGKSSASVPDDVAAEPAESEPEGEEEAPFEDEPAAEAAPVTKTTAKKTTAPAKEAEKPATKPTKAAKPTKAEAPAGDEDEDGWP